MTMTSDHQADVKWTDWDHHSTAKPCLACRSLVKGSELHAKELWCDPLKDGCGHFHISGPCPEIHNA